MSFLLVRRACLALALGILLAPAASAQLVLGDDRLEPVNRPSSPSRLAVPCDQAVATVTLAAGETIAFTDTTSGEGVLPGYACRSWSEAGPEHIYILDVTEDLIVDIWLGGNEPDLDLALLSECDTDSCLFLANTEISAQLPAGQYVVVVDGYETVAGEGGAAGPYTLTFESRALGLPAIVCEPGTAIDLGQLGESLAAAELDTSLFGRPNLVSIDDCASVAARGGEQWLTAVLAANDTTYDDGTDLGTMELTVTAAADSLDLVIWVYGGCGPDAACLGFVDEGPAGTSEQLELINDQDVPWTVYIAIDSVSPAIRETQAAVTITTEAVLPTRPRSLSDIRSLFR